MLRIDGIEVERLVSRSLHEQMGVVHQQAFLFEGSVMNNIRLARPEASDEEVVRVTEHLGFRDLIEALPEGSRRRWVRVARICRWVSGSW